MNILQKSQSILEPLMLIPVHCPFVNQQMKIVYPEESGLHPGNVDYVNTLKVVAAKRRGGEEAISDM